MDQCENLFNPSRCSSAPFYWLLPFHLSLPAGLRLRDSGSPPICEFCGNILYRKDKESHGGCIGGSCRCCGLFAGKFPDTQRGPSVLTQHFVWPALWGHGIDPLCSRFWSVHLVKHLILPIASWNLARHLMELTNWHGGIFS